MIVSYENDIHHLQFPEEVCSFRPLFCFMQYGESSEVHRKSICFLQPEGRFYFLGGRITGRKNPCPGQSEPAAEDDDSARFDCRRHRYGENPYPAADCRSEEG